MYYVSRKLFYRKLSFLFYLFHTSQAAGSGIPEIKTILSGKLRGENPMSILVALIRNAIIQVLSFTGIWVDEFSLRSRLVWRYPSLLAFPWVCWNICNRISEVSPTD
jgi:hypothetical protein